MDGVRFAVSTRHERTGRWWLAVVLKLRIAARAHGELKCLDGRSAHAIPRGAVAHTGEAKREPATTSRTSAALVNGRDADRSVARESSLTAAEATRLALRQARHASGTASRRGGAIAVAGALLIGDAWFARSAETAEHVAEPIATEKRLARRRRDGGDARRDAFGVILERAIPDAVLPQGCQEREVQALRVSDAVGYVGIQTRTGALLLPATTRFYEARKILLEGRLGRVHSRVHGRVHSRVHGRIQSCIGSWPRLENDGRVLSHTRVIRHATREQVALVAARRQRHACEAQADRPTNASVVHHAPPPEGRTVPRIVPSATAAARRQVGDFWSREVLNDRLHLLTPEGYLEPTADRWRDVLSGELRL